MAKRVHDDDALRPFNINLLEVLETTVHDVFAYVMSYLVEHDALKLMETCHKYGNLVLGYVDFYRYIYALPTINWHRVDSPFSECGFGELLGTTERLAFHDLILISHAKYSVVNKLPIGQLHLAFNRHALEIYRVLGVGRKMDTFIRDYGRLVDAFPYLQIDGWPDYSPMIFTSTRLRRRPSNSP